MRHIWTVLCENAIIDQVSNSVSLIQCLEHLSCAYIGSEPPATIPVHGRLVILWSRTDREEPERGRFRIQCRTPKKLAPAKVIEVDLSEYARSRNIVAIAELPNHGSGTYDIIVAAEDDDAWTTVATIPLEVEVKHQPAEVDSS